MSNKNIQLSIVTPERNVVSSQVSVVMAPGAEGEFGVLVNHTPFLTSLKTGIIRYTDDSGQEKHVFVSGGFAEVLPDKVTILAEVAEREEDIDVKRAQEARELAEKRLTEARDPDERERAREDLTRAMQRLDCCQL